MTICFCSCLHNSLLERHFLLWRKSFEMSKLSSLYRQLEIIRLAKKGPFTWNQLQDYLEDKTESTELKLTISKRTLSRDFTEIKDLFGLVIEFDFKKAAYLINKDESLEKHSELLEAFETIHAFGRATQISDKVFPEKKTPRGTEHLKTLLDAIDNHQMIQISYLKYYELESADRTIRPVALKEYLFRWYVLAWSENDELKFFGLDRINSITIVPGKLSTPKLPNLEDRFLQTIGIINELKEPVETVFLTFTRFKGQYILSMPLHPTQDIVEENQDTIQISLRVKLNPELISIILSHGDEVRVDHPDRLKEMVREKAENITLNRLLKEDFK